MRMGQPCFNIFPPTSKILKRKLSTITSTVYRGTEFEKRSLKILHDNMSMSLRRVGGKSDGGIDLLGWWWLPENSLLESNLPRRRFRIIAQCKAEKKKTSPKYVREMEGVLHRYISLERGGSIPTTPTMPPNGAFHSPQYPLVALLISESPFTKSTILRAQSSPVPFFLLHIPPRPDTSDVSDDEQGDRVGSAVWNPALAGVRGLLGGKMEIRWERAPGSSGRPGLWWHGQKLRSWTPGFEGEELSLTAEDAFFNGLAQEP
ncbi:hypothetical protein BDZ94DRAFT_1254462 [Collybia nuda]|uniref:Uncharacterized protein n=1 Tax=Collybia nuda TaxID=64659 RepID=A0A9P5YAF6_9AGAR|nr:hypothetical protein BDZ94DRAFT_1254462 [Collybia nuda]